MSKVILRYLHDNIYTRWNQNLRIFIQLYLTLTTLAFYFLSLFHLWQYSTCLSFLPSMAVFLKAIRVNSSGCAGHGSRLARITTLISSVSVSQSRGFKAVKIRFIRGFPPLLRRVSQESPVCLGCNAERSPAVFQISRYP